MRPVRKFHPQLCLYSTIFLTSIGTSMANVTLPTIAASFGVTVQQSQWVVIAYLISVTAFVAVAGRFGDTVDYRRYTLVGIVIFTSASAVAAWSPTFWVLIAARGFQGLGAAILLSVAMATIMKLTPGGRSGRAMGLVSTTSAVGTALGPSLGGFLASGLGWSSIFLFKAGLGSAVFLLAYLTLSDESGDNRSDTIPIDYRKAALFSLALVSFAVTATLGNTVAGVYRTAAFLFFLVLISVFVVVERTSVSPLIPGSIIGDKKFRLGLVLNFLVSSVAMASLVVGPFYLTLGLGLSLSYTGLVMSVGPLTSATLGTFFGWLVDRFGSQRIVRFGLAFLGAGSLSLSVLDQSSGIVAYLISILVVTVGYVSFLPANNTLLMAAASQDTFGATSGLVNLSRNVGLLTGAAVMGALFAFGSGIGSIDDASSSSAADGLNAAYIFCAGLIGLAAVIHLRQSKIPKVKENSNEQLAGSIR